MKTTFTIMLTVEHDGEGIGSSLMRTIIVNALSKAQSWVAPTGMSEPASLFKSMLVDVHEGTAPPSPMTCDKHHIFREKTSTTLQVQSIRHVSRTKL